LLFFYKKTSLLQVKMIKIGFLPLQYSEKIKRNNIINLILIKKRLQNIKIYIKITLNDISNEF
ncbi:MAG: hypothetical protein L0I45_04040, partial [Lactococcus lactis]|nr:hypothetical protein [Lactococcus lactis]